MPFTQQCRKCHNPINEGHAYELGDDRWHIDCFSCSKCSKSLGCNLNFLVLGNGNLICVSCSYNCKQCGKKIDDLAILTGDQAYCLLCFKCRVCKNKIEDLRYARTSKGLFCMLCHEKLIAKKKRYDQKRRQLSQLEVLAKPEDSPMALLLLLPLTVDVIGPSKDARDSNSEIVPSKDRGSGSAFSSRDTLTKGLPVPPEPAFSEMSSTTSAGQEIEEVYDSDDELNLRKMRERLERRFDRASRGETDREADLGAILELIDSISGPNTPITATTPNTVVTANTANDNGSEQSFFSPAPDIRPRDSGLGFSHNTSTPSLQLSKASQPTSRDVQAETPVLQNQKSLSSQLDPRNSDRGNLLLFSPSQYHDTEFHRLLPAEETRTRSAATLPAARYNRQARVVETNDEVFGGEILADVIPERNGSKETDSANFERNSRVGNEDRPRNGSFSTGNGSSSATLGSNIPNLAAESHTPKKKAYSNHVTSPPPRLALPDVPLAPSTPDVSLSTLGDLEPRGLGLEGVDLHKPQRQLGYVTPAVTNLEDTIAENTTPKRLGTLKKMSIKHKRSVSGGSSILSKFSLFKNKEDESGRGHVRHVSESLVHGAAFTTPPLPLSLPMKPGAKDYHTRLTLDTQFFGHDQDFHRSEMDFRALKIDVYQLENRKQSLLAENMRLSTDKSKLQEAIRALQKRLGNDEATHDKLSLDIAALSVEKRRLAEENRQVAEETERLRLSMRREQLYERRDDDSHYLESVAEDDNSETQKATRLRFWRKPKVAPNLVSTGQSSSSNLSVPQGIPISTSSHKLSQQYQSNAIQHPHHSLQHSQGSLSESSESGPRKALNTFMSKSRSTTLLDSLASNNSECALFSLTIQKRAIFENVKVPLIVTRCIEEVEKRGLDNEGIYRISGGNSAIVAIENAFATLPPNPELDKKQVSKLNDLLDGDINAVTSALKRYLRKLPDPLIPYSIYDRFIAVGQMQGNESGQLAEMADSVLAKLPVANRNTLYLLAKHLDEVNFYSHVNRMTLRNLSVVFAPTIARDASGEREMIDMAARNDATELLLRSYSDLFVAEWKP